jgi:hypothetical protein
MFVVLADDVLLQWSLIGKTWNIGAGWHVYILNPCRGCSLTCILRWASCKQNPFCPRCKGPSEFICIHLSIDGDSMLIWNSGAYCFRLNVSFFIFCSLDSALTVALWEILLSLSFVTKQNCQNIHGDIEIIRAVIMILVNFERINEYGDYEL